MGGPERSPHQMKYIHTTQDRKQLRRVAHLPTQFLRTGVHLFQFLDPWALAHHQRWSQSNEEGKFLLEAFGRVGQSLEQFQGGRQVIDCLLIR